MTAGAGSSAGRSADKPAAQSGARAPARTAAVWVAALAVTAAMLAWTGYRTRDPDSRAYVAIAAHLAARPAAEWIAPQWWGAWGRHGPFREHPAGTFILPALLARTGYPAEQASFVVTLAAQIVSLLLLAALAARLLPRAEARLLVWALLLLPIAFVFRVRANQEYLLLAGLVAALYCTERARERRIWIVPAVAAFGGALLVKGVIALLGPVLCAIWLAYRGGAGRARLAWLAPAAMVVLTPVAAIAYEHWYVGVTGSSFLEYYLGPRIGLESGPASVGLPFPLDKVRNALWYAGRLVWYAAPWSLVLAAHLLLRGRTDGDRARWVGFATAASVASVVLLAARDLTADRYIFPAYFLTAGAGVAVACARWPRVARLATQLDAYWPAGPALLWTLLVAGRMALA
ncbi:MAG TPA: glycosyltransferase family 39 protein [Vicinamibacterales bacterium]